MSSYVVVVRSPFVRNTQVAHRVGAAGKPIAWRGDSNAELYLAVVENSESGQDAIQYAADRFGLPPHALRAIPV